MEGKKSKKKVLLYYLLLAASLLVIAAVTVTVVFTVGRKPSNLVSDGQHTENPDDGNGGGGDVDPDDGKDKPTLNDGKYGLPLANANVSATFEFAYDGTLTRYAVHRGMDFKANAGDNVLAVMDGKVTKVVTSHKLNENYVTITHNDGVIATYMYVNAREGLKEGATIKKGDVIGTVAAAGGFETTEGDHLHLEMHVNGRPVDPNTYLEITEK